LVAVDERKETPEGIEHLERESEEVAERSQVLPEGGHVGLNQREQLLLGVVGVEAMVDARPWADARAQMGKETVIEIKFDSIY
jgi:hypothetical protein